MTEVEVDRGVLDEVERAYGFVPNLFREMARSAAVARVYLRGQEAMREARLSRSEQQLVQLAVAVYNECPYCRAAHRAGARRAGVSEADIRAVETGSLPEPGRSRTLVSATWQVLDTRGWLGPADLAAFEGQGLDRAQLYEVVALVGLKTISNYVNHIAHTPVDEAFRD